MTDETTSNEETLSTTATSITYVAEKLTDNAAFFACLFFGMVLIWVGLAVPEWLIAIIGMGANKYLKTRG